MFELIGIVVVCWIGFKVLRGFFRGASTVRGQEYGKEARHIATRDLEVPDSYYNYIVTNKIEALKNAADMLRERDDDFKGCSWPRVLALVIYGEFHQDCEQWKYGNPITEQLFIRIRITHEMINNELNRNVKDVIYENT